MESRRRTHHQDRRIPDVRYISLHFPNDMTLLQVLHSVVQDEIIRRVVVSFRQEFLLGRVVPGQRASDHRIQQRYRADSVRGKGGETRRRQSARKKEEGSEREERNLQQMSLDYPMHDRNFRSRYLVHRDVSMLQGRIPWHRQEEQISSLRGERPASETRSASSFEREKATDEELTWIAGSILSLRT